MDNNFNILVAEIAQQLRVKQEYMPRYTGILSQSTIQQILETLKKDYRMVVAYNEKTHQFYYK